jgi:hypothetical protein
VSTPQNGVPLPERDQNSVLMLWAKAGSNVKAYSFSPSVVGRYMHWGVNRTELCVKEWGDCPWCQARNPARWYGFLFGHSITHTRPCIIQLTEQCVRASLQLRDPGVNLRGAYIELARAATPRNAEVHALIRLDVKTTGLPSEIPDVLDHLRRWFRLPAYPVGRHSLNRGDDE